MSEMEKIVNLQVIQEQGEELMRALEDFLLNPDAKHGETVDFLAGLSRFAYQDSGYLYTHSFEHAGLNAYVEVDVCNVTTDGEKMTVSPYISHIKFENKDTYRRTSVDGVADITMIARDAIDLD